MRGSFEGFLTASVCIRTAFYEVDSAGVVWHGRYFEYLEDARCKLLESIGYSYDGMMESGYLWPVVDSHIRYIKPLKLNQKVDVVACLKEWEFRMAFDYRLLDETGAVCTRARTIQVPVVAQSMDLALGCPAVFVTKVEKAMHQLNGQSL